MAVECRPEKGRSEAHRSANVCRSFAAKSGVAAKMRSVETNVMSPGFLHVLTVFLQWFDAVGWAAGTASGQQKTQCWYVGGVDLTGAVYAS